MGVARWGKKGTFVQNMHNFWTENIHGSYFDGVVNYYLMETILDRFGRIVIPKKIRENFNLKAGTQIQIEENQKSIILTPVHRKPNLRIKNGVLVFSGVPLEELGESLTMHREERLKTIRNKFVVSDFKLE